jgi:hypothetical protein
MLVGIAELLRVAGNVPAELIRLVLVKLISPSQALDYPATIIINRLRFGCQLKNLKKCAPDAK